MGITMRTAEEAQLSNIAVLLTRGAQEEALEYRDLHYLRAAMIHEREILANKPNYARGDPDAILPENSFIDDVGNLRLKNGDNQATIINNPRVNGYNFYLREAYEKNGTEGIIQALKDRRKGSPFGTTGILGELSSDDVFKLQAEVVQGVRQSGSVQTLLHGPGLDDIRAAISQASVQEEVQATTESVSLARRTLSKILESSDVAAKIMRYSRVS